MQDLGFGEPAVGESPEAVPRPPRPLATTPQGVAPMTQDLGTKRIKRGDVAWNGMVLKVPLDHSAQPRALLWDGQVSLPKQRLLDHE